MTVLAPPVRVNLGSGRYPLDGWTNVDEFCQADIQADFRTLSFDDLGELRMSHLLEHLSWRDTVPTLRLVHGWMRPGGRLTVEVPDIDEIMKLGTRHPLWFKYVFGDQSTPGECHRAGFTVQMLCQALTDTGWQQIHVRRFLSDHPGRETMPCLETVAFA